MPTKKPIVQVVLEQDIYDKLMKICEDEERSASSKCKLVIKDYIKNYESKHGNIIIGEINQTGENNTINF